MNIKQYIESHPNKAEARQKLADDIGYEEVTVRSWANGNRFPSRKAMKLVFKATKGKVTVKEMIDGNGDQ
jgi:DNA-binding transcriptional regulator YdaS (Cro superfamily)